LRQKKKSDRKSKPKPKQNEREQTNRTMTCSNSNPRDQDQDQDRLSRRSVFHHVPVPVAVPAALFQLEPSLPSEEQEHEHEHEHEGRGRLTQSETQEQRNITSPRRSLTDREASPMFPSALPASDASTFSYASLTSVTSGSPSSCEPSRRLSAMPLLPPGLFDDANNSNDTVEKGNRSRQTDASTTVSLITDALKIVESDDNFSSVWLESDAALSFSSLFGDSCPDPFRGQQTTGVSLQHARATGATPTGTATATATTTATGVAPNEHRFASRTGDASHADRDRERARTGHRELQQ
jgi:hypothetical protein